MQIRNKTAPPRATNRHACGRVFAAVSAFGVLLLVGCAGLYWWVTVYCAGLPDDSCASVRGGGEAVRVEPEDDVAWLDFRYGGGVTGRVLLDGEPVEDCEVDLLRVPRAMLEDLPRGLLTGRNSQRDEDGAFRVEGLRPGTWRLGIRHGELDRMFPELGVDVAVVDLGDIELDAGGTIEGLMVDGLTGATTNGQWGLVTPASDGALTIPASAAETRDGYFILEGLPAGEYLVYPSKDPLEQAEVTLAEGGTAWVELELWDDRLPEDQGFSLLSGGAGELVVEAVEGGSAAESSGLAEGDMIAGVQVFGVDLSTLHPRLSDAALRYYTGPGLTLVVDRDGEQVEVELE